MDITSRDNRKISEYIRLRDKASERESEGLFTLEGARLVMDALKEHAALTDAFYTDQAAEKYPEVINHLKENLKDHAYKITPGISKKLCDTVNPQGVYAVAQKLDKFQESCKIVDGGKYLERLAGPRQRRDDTSLRRRRRNRRGIRLRRLRYLQSQDRPLDDGLAFPP